MTETLNGFQRWAELMDRAARDEVLTHEERAFCERFARDHTPAQNELAVYDELAQLDAQPDPESRALVESSLRRLESEDAERAVAEVRSLRPTRAPFWLVASAVGAVLLGIGLLHQARLGGNRKTEAAVSGPRPLTRAELVYASGHVRIEGRRAAAGRVLLDEGTRIETGDGMACVLVDSDINLCLAANSDMRLSALNSPLRRVDLGTGALATRLSAQPEGQNLTIAAGNVTSTAVGTAFSVEYEGNRSVVTTVLNGKVRVAHGGEERLVNAHERARSADSHVLVNSLSRTEEASSWALLGPTMLWHDPVSATLELSGEPAGAEALLDGQPIGRAPLSTLVPVGPHRLVVRHQDRVLLDQELHWNAGETRSIGYADSLPPSAATPETERPQRRSQRHSYARKVAALDLAAKLTPEPAAPAPAAPEIAVQGPTPSELLRAARRLVRDGQLRAAADTYQTLRRIHPSSEEAHTVLVSLGKLELNALHEPARALPLLDEYLQRGGNLTEEARLTRIQALRGLHRNQDEAKAIAEFLLKHPRSFEDTNLRARLAELRAAE
ncbi:MAG TPA: FecR domain-containing protein [Polyangiales bacterium]|nr:FecR domain-containing protein [Polyangiales bacterium]